MARTQQGAPSGERIAVAVAVGGRGRHRRLPPPSAERRAPRLVGGLALVGLAAMVAVPATTSKDVSAPIDAVSAADVQRALSWATSLAPARPHQAPRLAAAPVGRLPRAASLRVNAGDVPVETVGLGALSRLIPSTPAPAPAAASAPAAPPTSLPPLGPVDGSAGARIVAEARKYLGVPYVTNGASPAGFDCSGYTMWVYAHAGVASLPHNSEAQRLVFRQISQAAALPGDLIFYMSGGTSYHVAIYAGGNLQYAAPAPGQDVKVETIWSSAIVFGTIWH